MQEFNEKNSFSQKIVGFFKNNYDTLAIFLISIFYIFAGVLKIVPSGQTISSIISSSIINLIVGLLIRALLRAKGLKDGQNSDVFIATTKLYGEKLDKNTDKITKIDLYCDYHNEKKLIRKQAIFLRKYGLNYDKFIAGEYDDKEEYRKIIIKCRNLKCFTLNSTMMLNAVNIVDVEDKITNLTPNKYQARGITTNLFIGALCAILFAYYVPEEGTIKLTTMLWATLQVIINIVLGILGYITAENFIKNDLRTRVKYIINCFDEFESLDKMGFFDKKEHEALNNNDYAVIDNCEEGENDVILQQDTNEQ